MPIKDSLRLLVQGVRRISFDGENIERNQALRTDQNGTYYFALHYVTYIHYVMRMYYVTQV